MTPDIERAARASCRATCVATACEEADKCLAVNLGSEVDRATAILEALAEPSDAAVEPAAEALYRVQSVGCNPEWTWQFAIEHNFSDVVECRTEARAAGRAMRLAELGRKE